MKAIVSAILVVLLLVVAVSGADKVWKEKGFIVTGNDPRELDRYFKLTYLDILFDINNAHTRIDAATDTGVAAFDTGAAAFDTASIALFAATSNHDTLDAVRDTAGWALAAQDTVDDTLRAYITFLSQPAGHIEYTVGDYLIMADTFVTDNSEKYDTVALPTSYTDAQYTVFLQFAGTSPIGSDSLTAGLAGRTTSHFIFGKSATKCGQGTPIFWRTEGRK